MCGAWSSSWEACGPRGHPLGEWAANMIDKNTWSSSHLGRSTVLAASDTADRGSQPDKDPPVPKKGTYH